MIYLKAAIAAVLSLVILLLCFMFFTFNATYGLKDTLDSFRKNDFAHAKRQLEKLKGELSQVEVLLYTAYIEREIKNVAISDQQLEQAEKLAQLSQHPLLLEITLNQAFNAYQQGDEIRLFQHTHKLKEIAPKNPWTQAFLGIEAYEKEQYGEAQHFWKDSLPKSFLSEWMSKAFSPIFTPLWIELKMLRCQVANGHTLMPRERLTELQRSENVENPEEVLLLLALCYFKEAEEKPLDMQVTYHRIAASYFQQMSKYTHRFQKERRKIYLQVKEHLLQLIHRKELHDFSFYLSLLENSEASQERREVAYALMHIFQPLETNSFESCQEMTALINQMIPSGETRELLSRQFEDLFWQHLDSLFYGKISIHLSRNPRENAIQFGHKLVSSAKNVWKEDPKRGITLLKMGYEVPQESDRFKIEPEVKEQLSLFYQQAENDPSKLISILQVDKDLNFYQFEKDKVPFLSKANKLYDHKQYQEALNWAQLTLIYDPQAQDALRICGLCAFECADFRLSLKMLKRLFISDSQVKEAVEISQILITTPEQRNQLLDYVGLNNFTEEGKLKLALGLLTLYDSQRSLEILRSIKEPNNEVHAAIACAAFDNNQWDLSVHHFYQALYPYNAIEGLQAVAIHSLMALGKKDRADILLSEERAMPSNEPFSLSFRHFKQVRLDPIALSLEK